MLRDYQQRVLTKLYQWFEQGNTGNPCLCMPTGSGKSHIIAEFCKQTLAQWPDQQILKLTHVKELIEQNAEKLLLHWPSAPLGIYSAGMGMKQLGHQITFASIQSLYRRIDEIGHIDIVIVDECHLISHKSEGMYRALIGHLKSVNKNLRVIGLTATPYRLGHGYITDGDALFDDIIDDVTIEELIAKGHLSPLRSKKTDYTINTEGVHRRGGEWIESELQSVVNTNENNIEVIDELLKRAGDRRAWLLFCTGVDHAKVMCALLNECGIPSECILGETPKDKREQILADYKAGKYRALTNANVLTTGFDYPDIDLIALVRPTMSPGLYVQMAGRGMRNKSHTDHCLVLDFAGIIRQHGPIVNVLPPIKKGKGDGKGEAPVKVCEKCNEICPLSCKICPSCLHPFPEPKRKELELHDDDIMGAGGGEFKVTGWRWRKHKSFSSGKHMLSVAYYGALSDPTIKEYFPVTHGGYAGERALREISNIYHASCPYPTRSISGSSLESTADALNKCTAPRKIHVIKEGRFHRVTKRIWHE